MNCNIGLNDLDPAPAWAMKKFYLGSPFPPVSSSDHPIDRCSRVKGGSEGPFTSSKPLKGRSEGVKGRFELLKGTWTFHKKTQTCFPADSICHSGSWSFFEK